MIESIAASLGTKVAERWAALLLSPAFAFWALGAGAWIWARPQSATHTIDRVAALSSLAQGALSIGALLVVATSGFVVERSAPTALRVLQGYWPSRLRTVMAGRHRKRLEADDERWQKLYGQWESGSSTAAESAELLAIERRLSRVPARPEQVMPTRLGNVLRAAESRPHDWYGLDAVRCWPRLWLVLPDSVKAEVGAARADLDTAATWWVWGALTAFWTILSPWALLVAVVACSVTYPALVAAAARFGELVDATFDLHRGLLYDALGRERPASSEAERAQGEALTQALWRGTG
ncbi:MAG: hypothetical protein M3083_13020 [Actinomycetota bacterium]|nr:hypothetical protein [Actinomycetota bacterium]